MIMQEARNILMRAHLWLQMHACPRAQGGDRPQPYAHMRALMVRLPYACAIGPDSLLHSLVESDVPVQVRAGARPCIRACASAHGEPATATRSLHGPHSHNASALPRDASTR